jgi:hypothetical protein
MFDAYVVEIEETAAGILIRSGRSFVFHAVENVFAALEGMTFPSAAAAEIAARRLVRHRRRPAAAGA